MIELWPASAKAFELWDLVGGQRRTGPGGMFALDYGVVLALLDRRDLSDDERDEFLEHMRIMEAAAVEAMQAK